MNSPLRPRALWLLCALLGCNGLGRPVITKEANPPAEGPPQCIRKRPECQAPAPVGVHTEWAPRTWELKPCPVDPTRAIQSGAQLWACELNLALLPDLRELTNASLKGMRIVLGPGQQLTLRESELTQVAVVSAKGTEQSPAGELSLIHSTVWGSVLGAERMRVLSSIVSASSVQAAQVSVDDLQLTGSELSAESGTFAVLDMQESALLGCQGGIQILASGVKHSRIACQGRVQLYLSAIDLSSVDGEIEAEGSAFADGTFGLEYPTTLTGWNAALDNEVLCSGLSQVRSSAGAFTCVDCEGPLADGEGELCADPDKQNTLNANQCGALDSVALCESFPPARRPMSVP